MKWNILKAFLDSTTFVHKIQRCLVQKIPMRLDRSFFIAMSRSFPRNVRVEEAVLCEAIKEFWSGFRPADPSLDRRIFGL